MATSAASVTASLICLEKPQEHAYPVPSGGLGIGRRETCVIRLSGPTISSVQCEVKLKDGVFLVEDLSSNGSFLNGKLIGRGNALPLKHGDVIQVTKRWETIPAFQFRFHVHQPSAATPEAAQVAAAAADLDLPCEKLAERASANKSPTPSKGASCDREALQAEVERERLVAQRAALEVELAERRLALAEGRDRLAETTAEAAVVRQEQEGLALSLRSLLEDTARFTGESEALAVAQQERQQQAAEAEASLTALREAHKALLAESTRAREGFQEAEDERQRIEALFEKETETLDVLRRQAKSLAEDLQQAASALSRAACEDPSDAVTSCLGIAEQRRVSRSPPRVHPSSVPLLLGLEASLEGSMHPSFAPTLRVASPLKEYRPPLAERSLPDKENLLPAAGDSQVSLISGSSQASAAKNEAPISLRRSCEGLEVEPPSVTVFTPFGTSFPLPAAGQRPEAGAQAAKRPRKSAPGEGAATCHLGGRLLLA